jgi:Tol biopolymer transport system component
VSGTGLIAYRSGAATRRQLAWFDRSGKTLGVMGLPDQNGLTSPRLSPEGGRVVVSRTVQGNTDLWLLDGTRTTRFTFDAALDRYPVWSPKGDQIVFDSNRNGTRNLYLTSPSNAGTEKSLLETTQNKVATDWSPDGRFILYISPVRGDLWVLPTGGDRKPWPFLKTGFSKQGGQFSPDGRWVAYMSNESVDRTEVYVRRFVDPTSAPSADGEAGGQWQVSTAGGIYPRWRPDGKELYYIAPDGQLMASPMAATATTMKPGTPVALFRTHIYGGGTDNAQGRQYDVSHDGYFLINTVLDDIAAPITLLENWTPPARK